MPEMRELRGEAHGRRSVAPAVDVEEAIAGLVGVVAVRLVTRADGMVEEIHVAMGPAWRADTVRRDVQALLLHRFDLHVDPDVIHVAQQAQPPGTERGSARTTQPHGDATPAAQSGDTGPGPQPGGATPADQPQHQAVASAPQTARRRPALEEVRVVLRPDSTSVDVELRTDAGRLHGSARLEGPDGLHTAVATATLAALAETVDRRLEPVTIDVVDVGRDRIAIATVVASDGRSEQRLTGSALVRGHVEDAMTRAVLDATNSLHRG